MTILNKRKVPIKQEFLNHLKTILNIKCNNCGVGYREIMIEKAYYCGSCKRVTFTGFAIGLKKFK